MRPEIVHLIFGVQEDKEGGRNGWKEGGHGEEWQERGRDAQV